jgi:small-conductance mechanosensitive channel
MVRTFDNATLFVPNSDLIAGKLINWSHRDPTVRREITVGVAYGSDTEQVRDILLAAAKAHPRVLAHPNRLCSSRISARVLSTSSFFSGSTTSRWG